MSELLKIIGVGLVTLIAYLIVKPLKPEMAIFISIVGTCVILIFCVDSLQQVISTMTSFVEKTGINSELFSCVLKIVGIGYIIEFSSNICLDAGNTSMADKITLAGKIAIM